LQDLILLGALFLLSAVSLFRGYQFSDALAALPPASGKKSPPRSAAERTYFALLQQNMRFFATFAFFAYVVLPQCESRDIPRFPWVYAAGSIVPAALVVLFSDRL